MPRKNHDFRQDVGRSNVSENIFDRSYRSIATSSLGILTPIMVQDVIAGSKVQIGVECQTRTRPFLVPAFTRIREHFDYFFVPYNQIWRFYDNFKTRQSNYYSQLMNQKANQNVPLSLPYFTGGQLSGVINAMSDTQNFDIAGYDLGDGIRRIADMLGYGYQDNTTDSRMPNVPFNFFRAAAYQKIYQDYYRNDKYEAYHVADFNYDDMAPGHAFTSSEVERLAKLFQPHYRWKKKDYFTQATPDTLPASSLPGFFGFVTSISSAFPNSKSSDNVGAFSSQFGLGNGQGIMSAPSTVAIGSHGSDDSYGIIQRTSTMNPTIPQVGFSSQHKFLAAADKYLRRIYNAHSDFNSQMEAVFGVSVPKLQRGLCEKIGGFSNVISISDVNNNSAEPSSTQPAGKVDMYNKHKPFRHFCAHDGIVMCIYSTTVENDYQGFRSDRFTWKHVPEDFFNPSFQNLGKQPIFKTEYFNMDDVDEDSRSTNPVIGFIPRYDEYRTHVDEVHGSFNTSSLSQWSTFTNNDIGQSASASNVLNSTNLIIRPSFLDRCLAGSVYDGYSNDQFYLNVYNTFKVIAPMSKSELM